jgi:hypothetical protein
MAKAPKAEVQKVEEVAAQEAAPQATPEPKQPKAAKTNPVEAFKHKMKIYNY